MSAEQRLINAGATLANIAFNLAQRGPGEFTARDAMVLDQARKDWDAARSATQADAAEVGEDARRLAFLCNPKAGRYIEEENGMWRVYHDIAPASAERHDWRAMTMKFYPTAAEAIDAAAPADSSMGGGER